MHSTTNRTTVFNKLKMYQNQKLDILALWLLLLLASCQHSLACSSRTVVPKPRSSYSSSMSGTVLPATQAPTISTSTARSTTTTTARPNITFPTYKCPETFDAWYCLNDAHCFAVKIGELPVYSCECATGFMGQRCEYKEIDGSYLPKRPRPMLEKASIASGAMCALVFMLIVCLALYLRIEQRAAKKSLELQQEEEDESSASDSEQCACCRAQCCLGADAYDALAAAKLPYHMRLEQALMSSLAIRRSTKL